MPVPAPSATVARKSQSPSLLTFSIWHLFPLLVLIPAWVTHSHYRLPPPQLGTFSVSGGPQISEKKILADAKTLSETIGYRIVGTKEHARGDDWGVMKARELKRTCDSIVTRAMEEKQDIHLECEWDRQQGSGTHRFDMMDERLYKSYQNLTNVIFRISDGTEEGKSRAILLNSHIDSTLPSPGAADDAMTVGIMLDVARVLMQSVPREDWFVGWSVIFLFNNAEESLQDGSHLFSTQHPWAPSVHAVINLEAAGTTGPELLFQATSEEMIGVYEDVKYPYGTVLANDIFASGIIMSDTDFRQFDQYLSVPGLDFAVVGNSYFYHTQLDIVQNIEPGVAQHFAENILHITKKLSARPMREAARLPDQLLSVKRWELDPTKTSLLEGVKKFDKGMPGGRRPPVVFFSLFGKWFVRYSFDTAIVAYSGIVLATVVLITFFEGRRPKFVVRMSGTVEQIKKGKKGTASANGYNASKIALVTPTWKIYGLSLVAVGSSIVGGVLVANTIAFVMRSIVDRQLSWFQEERRCLWLYAPATILGMLSPLPIISSYVHPASRARLERATIHATLVWYLLAASGLQYFEIGSAIVFVLLSTGMSTGLAIGETTELLFGHLNAAVSPVTYLFGSIVPLAIGTDILLGVTDVFVPLTGRIGSKVPAEHIIASIVGLLIPLTMPLLIPISFRIDTQRLKGTLFLLRICCVIAVGCFTIRFGSWPFDPRHPRRTFITWSEDLATNSVNIHVAKADGAPGFKEVVLDLAKTYGALGNQTLVTQTPIDNWHNEWDSLYPFSQHLGSWTFPITRPDGCLLPVAAGDHLGMRTVEDTIDLTKGTRSLTLEITHKGSIWTVIAFDAHVLSWNLDDHPPHEYTRHHVKEASYYGESAWRMNMVIRWPPPVPTNQRVSRPRPDPENPKITVDFSGIVERGIWPAKKKEYNAASEEEKTTRLCAMRLFEKMDVRLRERSGDSMDVLFMETIIGSVDL